MSAYCDRSFLEARWARSEVEKWADRSGDRNAAEIDQNVTEALNSATDEINDALRGGVYEVPFTGTIPFAIRDLCRKQAAVLLYSPRGAQDVDPDGNPLDRFEAIRSEIKNKLQAIKSGRITLAVDQVATTTPFVHPVAPRRDDDVDVSAGADEIDNWA